jgi:hypothetical protein
VGRPIRSIGRAGAFVDDVGFALLFPTAAAALPSLHEAASQQPCRCRRWCGDRMRSGAGWPSAVLELTARAFDLGGGEADEVARRRQVGRRFLASMVVASAGELASAWLPTGRCRRRARGAGGRGEVVGEAATWRPRAWRRTGQRPRSVLSWNCLRIASW